MAVAPENALCSSLGHWQAHRHSEPGVATLAHGVFAIRPCVLIHRADIGSVANVTLDVADGAPRSSEGHGPQKVSIASAASNAGHWEDLANNPTPILIQGLL